jgi:hypothetical protein
VSWQDADSDCREPLIVTDDQLTSDLAEKRHTFPNGTDAPWCLMTGFYSQVKLAQILTHVIQIAFGLQPTNYAKIMKLDAEVETFRREIFPKVLSPESPTYDPKLEPISIVMQSFYHKTILLLHRPFIGRAHENPQFKWSRDRAVAAALVMVEYSITLFTKSNFLVDSTYAAKPMLAHGLFPAPIALALDLYTWPDQPNPETSRQALLEIRHVYHCLSVQFVLMKKLYKILNVVMGKAWEKAGLHLPADDILLGSLSASSTSTPSPINPPSFDPQTFNPQGVVPTSFQFFNPVSAFAQPAPFSQTQDWTAQMPQSNLVAEPHTWDPNISLVGTEPGYSSTSQAGERYDPEATTTWVDSRSEGLTRRTRMNGICL